MLTDSIGLHVSVWEEVTKAELLNSQVKACYMLAVTDIAQL